MRSRQVRRFSAAVFASAILTAVALLLTFLPFVDAGISSHVFEAAAVSDVSSPVTALASHRATQQDIDDLKARFGVRQPGDPYSPVVVDGYGTGLAPHTEREWDMLVGELLIFEAEPVPTDVPTAFDLSGDPEFPAVGNQASQGSCSAWAAAYYSYGYLEAVDNAWTEASMGQLDQLLSPAWTYNMVNGGRDQGSPIDTNMMVIRDWGTATLATMPYDDDDATSWGSPEAFREAPLHRGSEVGYIDYDHATTVDTIKAIVAAGTPVAFAIDANEYTSGFSDGNYIISSSEYSSISLNHAQTIVGFDDTLADDADTGAFRVVNSWGDDWGDSGYYWFTYAALEELGSLDLLYLNFMVDVQGYQPSLLGVWHFDDAPSRNSSISLSVGPTPVPENTKVPFYDGGFFSTMQVFPTFMCLDMTEHASVFWSQGGMHLEIGDSRTDGTVSSFRVEAYDAPYIPGVASQLSEQSPDVPSDTPSTVGAYLEYYDRIDAGDALECSDLDWSSSGQASWVGVDHHSSGDDDSMQSGDVSDNAFSRLEAQVEGPAELSFDWMVSSQTGSDSLTFEIDDSPHEEISGLTGWETVSVTVGAGLHTLSWVYHKDATVSSYDDSAWLDSVVLSEYVPLNSLPSITALTVSPESDYVLPGSTVTFQVEVQDEEGGRLTVVSSYGDGAEDEQTTSGPVPPMETVSFWFNHTYLEGSDTAYSAEFTVMDEDEHPLLDWDMAVAEMIVNSPPTAVLSVDPAYASTGELVTLDASGSTDAETGTSSLRFRWDWTGDGVWDTDWSSSAEASHYYSAPGDYDVLVQVMDGIGLLSVDSVSVTVTGEAIPEFSMVLVPVVATMMVVLLFARASRRDK